LFDEYAKSGRETKGVSIGGAREGWKKIYIDGGLGRIYVVNRNRGTETAVRTAVVFDPISTAGAAEAVAYLSHLSFGVKRKTPRSAVRGVSCYLRNCSRRLISVAMFTRISVSFSNVSRQSFFSIPFTPFLIGVRRV
jgi:hypothetical protein